MVKAAVDTSQLKQFQRQLKTVRDDWDRIESIGIFCKATERTSSENTEIYRRQMSEGRDPFFLEQGERNKSINLIEDRLADALEGSGAMSKRAMSAMGTLGKLFVEWIRGHIVAEKSDGGRMRPLSKTTQRYKDRNFPGKPILVRTGQLVRSIAYEVRRKSV